MVKSGQTTEAHISILSVLKMPVGVNIPAALPSLCSVEVSSEKVEIRTCIQKKIGNFPKILGKLNPLKNVKAQLSPPVRWA